MASVGDFFAALYERFENADCTLTVYGPKKGPFKTAPTTKRWEEDVKGKKDIYFRLHPVNVKPDPGKRGVARMSSALCFVALDIDCGDKGNGKSYFPTKEEAIKWIKEILPWSIIVDSGAGLHVYVVLEEPIYINDDESFARAHLISERFSKWAMEQCKYDLDSVHDLARVLRVPGTIHSGTASEVSVLELRTNTVPAELLEGLPLSKKLRTPLSQTGSGEHGFVLDPNCELDQDMVMQIGMINMPFWETWNGAREPGDSTPSGLRFSMISFLMNSMLERQDVANLTVRYLIDKKGLDASQIKLDRPDIWHSEMLKCEVKTQPMDADALEELVKEGATDKQMGVIADLMGFDDPTMVTGISRFAVVASQDENEIADMVIRLHIKNMGEAAVVSISEPLNRAKSQQEIWKATGIAFPYLTGKQATIPNEKWRKAMEIGWHLARELDSVDNDVSAQLMRAIVTYVNNEEMADSLEEARETGKVYRDGDKYVVPTAALNAQATATYPDLRSGRSMHRAVMGLKRSGVDKAQQKYKGVRMACLLVPVKLAEEQI